MSEIQTLIELLQSNDPIKRSDAYETLTKRLVQLKEELSNLSPETWYPTMGDTHGPYSDMYGRESEPNPEYEWRQEAISIIEDSINSYKS